MIKIMHCISDTNFGGAGRVLLNYLNHYDTNNFEISVVLPRGSVLMDYLNLEKYRVIEFDGLYDRSFNFADIQNLKRLIKTEQPDIVHSHGALSARIAARQVGKKVVYTRHSVFDLPKWQTSFPGKQVLGAINNYFADCIIAVSPAAKTLLVKSGTKESKIEVVFNGVEALSPCSKPQKSVLKEKFLVNENEYVCSIIARLEEFKGHRFVIEAARVLKEQGITDFCILVAGTGEAQRSFMEYAKQCGVEDVVRFLGFVRDVDALLSITDLQLNASFAEATSMSLLEGFSLGVPAVVSSYGGNPYVVDDGINGIVFPKRDSTALAEAILRMMEDKQFYYNASTSAKKSFDERFTAQSMTKNMEEVYYKLMRN